ncbi:MAG: GWxTD domain-containing protein [Lentimicrobium sp.]|nr:GWxTD domain-containing protein [Lentimicrobium sp.]
MRFTKNIFVLFALGIALVFQYSCKSPARLAYRNIASFYNPESEIKGLKYDFFHLDDTLTKLYVSFPYKQLVYKAEGNSTKAKFRFFYQIYDGYDNSILLDSASYYGVDSLNIGGIFMDSIPLVLLRGRNYILNTELSDLNSGITNGRFLKINKQKEIGEADFILVGTDNLPLLRNFIVRNETFRVKFIDTTNKITIAYFPGKKEIPGSPYAFQHKFSDFEVDSIFNVEVEQGLTNILKFEKQGSYFVKVGDEYIFLVHCFYDGFPEIGTVNEMRESLRYISTEGEFRDMQSKPARAAVDDFWIRITGHPERALQQIKNYYKRVEEANRFFALSSEGWKSDRGMIYIVYGPPSIVFRNMVSEEWTYGEAGNPLSVRFLFNLEPIWGNMLDYKLVRSENYRNSWHLAVSNWRR